MMPTTDDSAMVLKYCFDTSTRLFLLLRTLEFLNQKYSKEKCKEEGHEVVYLAIIYVLDIDKVGSLKDFIPYRGEPIVTSAERAPYGSVGNLWIMYYEDQQPSKITGMVNHKIAEDKFECSLGFLTIDL